MFNGFRSHFEVETLRLMATWYSRMVILTETLGGTRILIAARTLGFRRRHGTLFFNRLIFECLFVLCHSLPDWDFDGWLFRSNLRAG
ncbi:hypothetical protein Pla52n_45130 [Stieleria varia]|uniref:Uncharacterized protein n=1 Tax=Stieleria varia TaxID=2528005 RepID=A0A5C6ANZ1_9BACT|nr:hypothetical protein Pla52n_45130 [Stieleria varia]